MTRKITVTAAAPGSATEAVAVAKFFEHAPAANSDNRNWMAIGGLVAAIIVSAALFGYLLVDRLRVPAQAARAGDAQRGSRTP